MDATFELAFPDAETARLAADRLRSEGYAVDMQSKHAPAPAVVARLTLPLDEFDAALSRMHALASELGGAVHSHWQSDWPASTHRVAVGNGVKSIRRICREVVQGRILPEVAINRIATAAVVSSPPGRTPWPETRIWPIYRRFRSIELRWAEAQEIHGVANVPQEQLEGFRQETLDAARDLLPD